MQGNNSTAESFVANAPSILILFRTYIFTALHGMQSRYSDGISVCPSVCPSVRPSVCQTRAL